MYYFGAASDIVTHTHTHTHTQTNTHTHLFDRAIRFSNVHYSLLFTSTHSGKKLDDFEGLHKNVKFYVQNGFTSILRTNLHEQSVVTSGIMVAMQESRCCECQANSSEKFTKSKYLYRNQCFESRVAEWIGTSSQVSIVCKYRIVQACLFRWDSAEQTALTCTS